MADDQNLNTTTDQVEENTNETPEPQVEEVSVAQEESGDKSQEAIIPSESERQVEESASTEPTEEIKDKSENSEPESTDSSVAPQNDDTQTVEQPSNDNPNARWYVVHTYSGHENKVATTLKQKVETERLEDKILDVLVPVQDKIEIKNGKKATIKEKIFPGYILVKMVLDDDSWLAVRTTQGVTSFVGIGNKPTPISEKEVQTIVAFTKTTEPVYKQVFTANDTVKIVEGPFAEFIGKVDSVDEEKGKVRVLVSIFGRETPVELDFLQVQKI